jgi:hypothetical protein
MRFNLWVQVLSDRRTRILEREGAVLELTLLYIPLTMILPGPTTPRGDDGCPSPDLGPRGHLILSSNNSVLSVSGAPHGLCKGTSVCVRNGTLGVRRHPFTIQDLTSKSCRTSKSSFRRDGLWADSVIILLSMVLCHWYPTTRHPTPLAMASSA